MSFLKTSSGTRTNSFPYRLTTFNHFTVTSIINAHCQGNLQQKLHERKRREVVRASGGLFGFTAGSGDKGLSGAMLVTSEF